MRSNSASNMSPEAALLKSWFPHTEAPFICGAPMRTVSGPELAAAVNAGGGLGFLGVGYTLPTLAPSVDLSRALLPKPQSTTVPVAIGIGLLNWNISLSETLPLLLSSPTSAVWLFGPSSPDSLTEWTTTLKSSLPPATRLFVQVGSLTEARHALTLPIDVLVVQGVADAGGHGLQYGASIVTLLPEVLDLISSLKSINKLPADKPIPVLAAGGIMDGRGVAAALVLGAHGAVLGTRLIATVESEAHDGFKELLVNTEDGGQNTVRTRLYDELRGTGGWPKQYNGRAVVNESYRDEEKGVKREVNRERYERAVEENDFGRLTAFAGTGIGLIRDVRSAKEIVKETREQAKAIL
ncbi:putative oxidoreductase, partial [Kalaharituber pfeilii]